MPVEDYLLPDEEVLFWSDFDVDYLEERYRVFISRVRILLYRKEGLLFKKEEVITENWQRISGLHFTETGRIRKRGVVRFNCSRGEMVLEGPKNGMLSLFKAIQGLTLEPWRFDRAPHESPDYP